MILVRYMSLTLAGSFTGLRGIPSDPITWHLCGNCGLPKNFYIRRLGEIKVFFAVNKFEPWKL